MTVAALIAAAGRSSRMGTPKALLPIGESTFIEHIADCVLRAGISRIFVSLPECERDAQRIRDRLRDYQVQLLSNKYPKRELLGSVQSALVDADFAALMIIPVDMPFITETLIERFCKAGAQGSRAIFCATCRRQPGHPVMFTNHFFAEIAVLVETDSLRTIMIKHPSQIVQIETDDPRLLLNINTPEDHERFVNPSAKNFDAAAIEAPGVKFL